MYFVRLKVDGLRAIESADVELGRGLNVLYGPNDSGKSTLAAAIRAGLLLPVQSSEGQKLVSWHRRDQAPRVVLQLVDDEDRRWRVRKTFGDKPSAELEATKDDVSFSPDCSGREVEEKLRSLLGWGIPGPGGKGGTKGLPHSFLTQVLLAEQTDVRAILEESLEEDKDGSGKLRLTAALKTLAQDPLFKKVLDGAQAGYDRYFANRAGLLKRGKNSPFFKMAEEIKKRSDDLAELTKKREESKSAESRLVDLRREHGALLEAVAETSAEVERAQALRERAREHEALLLRLTAARARLGDIETEIAATEEKHRAMETLRAEASRRVAALREADQASELAHRAARDAEDALRQASSDDAARDRDLQRAQIEGQRAALQAKIADADAQRTRALLAVEAIEAEVRAEGQRAQAVAALETKRRALSQAHLTLNDVAAQLLLTKGLWAYGRFRDGLAAEQESRAAGEDALRCRAEADALGAEVTALEASLLALSVPTEAEVRTVTALRHAKDLAEAALGGGLSVVVTPKRPLMLRAATDGTWKEATAIVATVEVEAEGKLELQIDDLVDIRVSAGDALRRKAAETLRQRWLAEGEPVLARAGVSDVVSLEARVKSAGELARRIEAGRREMATLHDKAKGREARVAELEPTVRTLAEREAALVGLDRTTLEQRYLELGKQWEQPARAMEARQESALTTARAAVAALDRELAGLEEGGKHAEEQRASALVAREAALALVGPEPMELARRASAELDAARRQGEILDVSLARITAGGTAEVEQARRALDSARVAVKAADTARAEATTAATEARSRVDRAAGEVAMWRERADALDRVRAEAAVRSSELAVTAFGPVDGLPTDADVDRAQAVAADRRAVLGETTRALDAAEGALQQVGGATIQDALADAQRAKDNALEQERELDVTARSWQLLRDKLQQAEEAEGAHLGRALGAPVAERLGELTEGRYGALTLGPTLKTENVEVRGGGSPEDALSFLSVGTLEQLATLVRIAVAEHLRSAIVLDDHLVQSDRTRLEWFRRMLRRTATHTQLLVLTCRPDDYLEASEIPAEGEATREVAGGAVRAINLARVIRRWQLAPGAATV